MLDRYCEQAPNMRQDLGVHLAAGADRGDGAAEPRAQPLEPGVVLGGEAEHLPATVEPEHHRQRSLRGRGPQQADQHVGAVRPADAVLLRNDRRGVGLALGDRLGLCAERRARRGDVGEVERAVGRYGDAAECLVQFPVIVPTFFP